MLKTLKRTSGGNNPKGLFGLGALKVATLLALATQLSSLAQTVPLTAFLARTQKGKSGLSLPYRLFVPKSYDASKRYPLVLCLHGVGESGTDNAKQVTAYQLAPLWAADSNQSKHPA